MSSFSHLVIISYQCILNSVGERGQPRHSHLLILASFDSLELCFINILLCVCVSTVAFNNVSGIFIDFKISNKICLCAIKCFFMISTQQEYFHIVFHSFFN